jgi:hypothetical protein
MNPRCAPRTLILLATLLVATAPGEAEAELWTIAR